MTTRTIHPNSLANLRPWTKGTSPAKNQSGPIISPALRRMAQMLPHDFLRERLDRMTVGENIAWVLLWLATQADYAGSERARTEVLNRLDGMLKGDVTINAGAGSDVKIGLMWADGEQA